MTAKSTSVNKSIKKAGKKKTSARLSPALKSLLERADCARHEFRYQEADELYTQAIDSGKLDPAHEFGARYGRLIMRVGTLEARKADTRQMIKLARALKDPIRQIRAQIEDIKAADESDADSAMRKAKTILKDARQLQNRELEAEATYVLGIPYFLKYEFQTAMELFRKSLAMSLELGDRFGEALSLTSLGASLSNLGNAGEAIKHFQRALEIFRDIGDRDYEAAILRSLGNTTNDFASQLDFHNQSLQINRQLSRSIFIGNDYNNLSISYSNLGLYRKARELGELSVQIARKHNEAGLAFCLESLSRPYLALRNYEEALKLLDEGLLITRKLKSLSVEASYLQALGRASFTQGNVKEARKHLRAALKISQQSSNELDVSSIQAWLAAVELAFGNEKAARQHSLKAVKQLERNENFTFDHPPQEIWWWRYQILARTGSKEEAFEALQKARRLMLETSC
jgi:tetratricopeptide (TPR) repeat protein